jgi:hypothetical protein
MMTTDDVTTEVCAPLFSPWGPVQSSTRLTDGVWSVGTSTHGGVMVHCSVTEKLLSPAALACGQYHGAFVAYEEDSAWVVAVFEMPQVWPVAFAHRPEAERTDEAIRAELLASLSRWKPEYLLARGLTPEAKHYERYLVSHETEQRRAAHDPDLIVCAEGAHRTGRADVVLVTTADEHQHRVTTASYHAVMHNSSPLLLSACVSAVDELVVEAVA